MADITKLPNADLAYNAKVAEDQAREAYKQRMESSRPASRGSATSFDNQYNVGSYMYPSDLMDPSNKYAGNYVIFYINVHEDSILFRNNSASVVNGNIPNRTKGYLSGQQIDESSAKKTATAVNGLGGAGAGAIANAVGGFGLSSGSTIVGATVGGLATLATINEIGKIKSEYKRINQAIALHMPLDLNVSYGVQWAEENMGGVGALLGMGENVINAITDDSKGISGRMDELVAGFNTASSFVAGTILSGTPVGNALSKTSGVASNPKKEQMFQSVDFRTFNFNYSFFARSPEEASNVRSIIKLFKMHMHPEYKKNTGNFLYLYPSEFDIFYYNNGVENMNLHRHTSCVLTNMTVQYTPNGQFNSFDDGMPTKINVTLTFKELALLDKELIDDGF